MAGNMDWSNVLERAGWTSVQAGLAAIPVAQVTAAVSGGELEAVATLGLAFLGAAIGGALSFIKTIAQDRLTQLNQA